MFGVQHFPFHGVFSCQIIASTMRGEWIAPGEWIFPNFTSFYPCWLFSSPGCQCCGIFRLFRKIFIISTVNRNKKKVCIFHQTAKHGMWIEKTCVCHILTYNFLNTQNPSPYSNWRRNLIKILNVNCIYIRRGITTFRLYRGAPNEMREKKREQKSKKNMK